MNRLGVRVKRLLKETHTFVTNDEWKLLADYVKRPIKPVAETDFKKLLEILEKKGDGYRGLFKADILKWMKYDRVAADKTMQQAALEMVQTYPSGCWVENSIERFFELLDEANRWKERS